MPGPAPDPNALRRARPEDQAGWTTLPVNGRRGPAPDWPLLGDIDKTARLDIVNAEIDRTEDEITNATVARTRKAAETRLTKLYREAAVLTRTLEYQRDVETSVWNDIWASPQADAWDKLGWTREVAQYVRHKVLGELGSLDDAKEARQWSDRLGLNPTAMLKLRWKVGPTTASPQTGRKPAAKKRVSSRDRMRVIDGGKS